MAYVGAPLVKADFSSEITVSGDVTVDTNVLVVDTTNNRVGIGTSSPANILEVSGASPVLEIDAQTGNPELQFSDGGTDEFSIQYDTGSNALRFVEGGVGAQVVIKDGGNVGIGTSSPDTNLNIGFSGADDNNTFRIEGSNGSSERYAFDIEANGENAKTFFKVGSGGGAPSTKMTLTSTGNVGIGTTSPASTLHLSDSANNSQLTISSTDYNSINEITAGLGHLSIFANTTQQLGASYRYMNFGIGTSEYMRINSSGNVGIGTTSPSHMLHAKTTGTDYIFAESSGSANNTGFRFKNGDTDWYLLNNSNGDLQYYNGTQATTPFHITADTGKVGIGTTSPSRKVSVFDSVNGYNLELSQTSAYNSGNQSGIVFSAKYNTGGNVTDLSSIRGGKENTTDGNFAGNLRFHTRTHNGTDTERMRIDSSGNVGIGTSSPSTSLDVVRNGVQPLRVQSTSGTEVNINMVNTGGNVQLEAHSGNFNIDADNVGIGTTSPDGDLDIRNGTNQKLIIGNSGNYAGGEYGQLLFKESNTELAKVQWNGTGNEFEINNKVSSGTLSFKQGDTQRMQISGSGQVIVTGQGNDTSVRNSSSTLMPAPNLIINGTSPPQMENKVVANGTTLNWFYEGFPRRYGNSSHSTFQTVTLNAMFIANNSTTTRDMFNLGFDKGWSWHFCEIEVFGIYYISGYRKYLLRNHSSYSTPFVTETQQYGYGNALPTVTMTSNGRFLHGTRTATSTSAHDTSYYDMHVELNMPAYSRAFVRVTFLAPSANNFRYNTDIINGREVRLYNPV